MALMRVTGFDPSLRNWGAASGTYETTTGQLTLNQIGVTQPDAIKGKQVRQNSKDLYFAEQLAAGIPPFIRNSQAIFVEVPIGSQSARAMASYGVCVGVLGSLRAHGIPFFEVTPTQVKVSAIGDKQATKDQMIKWAMELHPYAKWPMQTIKGETSVIAGKAEHIADAIGAIHAGVDLHDFKQMIQLLNY